MEIGGSLGHLSTTQRVYRLFPVLLVLVTLAVFAASLGNGFVNWDDDKNFTDNPDYRGLGPQELKWMWTSHLMGRYIPITWMTLGLDFNLWGMDPFGYHLTNVAVHAANAVLFYFLAIALLSLALPESSVELRSRIPIGALFAALIFAIHPLRVESVVWITERRDVVSGMFSLLAILAYLRAVQDGPSKPVRRTYFWLCFASFVLAVLSKEMAVTLPALFLILDVYPLRRLPGARALWVCLEKVPFLIVSAADSVLAMYFGRLDKLTASIVHIDLLARMSISIYSLAFYVRKTLLPFRLSPFYSLTHYRVYLLGLPFLGSAALVVLLTVLAIHYRRRLPGLWVAWAAYCVALLPVSGVFHNGLQIAADRYSYWPCLSLAVLAGAALLVVSKSAVQSAAIVAAVTCLLGYLTVRQSLVWNDSETLWRHALAIDNSALAWNNLGMALSARSDHSGAIDSYRRAIQIDFDYAIAHNNLGGELLELGVSGEAEQEFRTAVKLQPDFAKSQAGLASALMTRGDLDGAIQHFRIALQLSPTYQFARDGLEKALGMKSAPGGK